jgi:predicted  nucleic acid-binding Zn-ribbon protein
MTYAKMKRLKVLDARIGRKETALKSLQEELDRLRSERDEIDASLTAKDKVRILKRAQVRIGRKIDEQDWIRSELEMYS